MKSKVVALAGALMIAYIGFEYLSFRRTLATANLPLIPLGVTRNYPDTTADNEPYTILILGDSTAQGIGAARPEDSFGALVAQNQARRGKQVRFVNLGVSGAQVRDVRTEQVPKVAALQPDLVLLSVGANDVTAWTAPSEYLDHMEQLVSDLVRTDATVAVLNVPAIIAAPLLPYPVRLVLDERTRRYNRGLAQLLKKRPSWIAVRIYEEAREPFERDRTLFASDGYHPSSKGYALWARITLHALAAENGETRPLCGDRNRRSRRSGSRHSLHFD
ncbi:MAG: SGNH/GDSL hydrolase family protein [Chloroflexota bacterium]|nr:SGNH/GDSL hydrolase family protein [Chloroflexota bacterium]